MVSISDARAQRDQIHSLHEQLEVLAQKQAGADAIESLIQPLLTSIKIPGEKQKQYHQRLAHGLRHYYVRHYRSSGITDESEE